METNKGQREDRETVAKREIGHTDIGRGLSLAMVSCFLAVIVAVPLADLALGRLSLDAGEARRDGVWASRPRGLFASNRAVLRWIRQFEDRVGERSVLRDLFLPPARTALTQWLRSGSETVCIGRDGWLFFRPAVEHLTGMPFLDTAYQEARRRAASELERVPEPDPLPAILGFRDALASRGVELILLPIPVKAAVHPERLSSRYATDSATLANPSFAEFAKRLRRNGIRLVDPAPELAAATDERGSAYLARDTHWTPAAMQRVARFLAAQLQTCGVRTGLTEFSVRDGSVAACGDLARMLSPPGRPLLFEPETVAIREVGQSQDGPAPVSADGSEVLLLGDSFTAIYSDPLLHWGQGAGLGEHLALALGAPVATIARNDDGAFATRLELAAELTRGRDPLAGKRVVVWEFAARELSFGDWRLLALPSPQPEAVPKAAPREPFLALCRVTALGPVPRPGANPYRDHLTWVLLQPLPEPGKAGGAAVPPGEAAILGYVRTLADDRPAFGAELRIGHRVRFRLRPWEAVQTELGRVRRDDPGEVALLELDPWFAAPADAGSGGPALAAVSEGALTKAQAAGGPAPAPAAAGLAAPVPAEATQREALVQACARLAAQGEGMTVRGVGGWLFQRSEIRQMTLSSLTDPETLRATGDTRPPDQADPVAAIAAYSESCRERGIRLLVVPIPAKCAVYPEKLDPALAVPPSAVARADSAHQALFTELTARGVEVLDVLALFLDHRHDPGDPLFCRTDTHFSGRACQVLAAALAARIRDEPWAGSLVSHTWERELRPVTIDGDLRRALSEAPPETETLDLCIVSDPAAGTPAPADPQSPVLILADSHGLVFHDGGDMHATGAGLADCLAAELGSTVDLIAVRGSAARPARISLYRQGRADPDWLARKRLIIWCFTVREFVDSPWGTVPLAR
jgi:alginate O-acetyltransferase complex protein AlgJ